VACKQRTANRVRSATFRAVPALRVGPISCNYASSPPKQRPRIREAAGDTSQTVRDIIQAKLLGPIGAFGTGLIRKALIVRTTSDQGIPDAVQDIYVKHKTDRTSWLTLKSYDQNRLSLMLLCQARACCRA
jgi:hypothetical protein